VRIQTSVLALPHRRQLTRWIAQSNNEGNLNDEVNFTTVGIAYDSSVCFNLLTNSYLRDGLVLCLRMPLVGLGLWSNSNCVKMAMFGGGAAAHNIASSSQDAVVGIPMKTGTLSTAIFTAKYREPRNL